MTPPVAQSDIVLIGSERDQLEAFLDDNRQEILDSLNGVTEEQARRRVVPSLTTLLGLVKHATFVERVWFEVSLLGRTRAGLGLPEAVDPTFLFDEQDTIANVRAEYEAAVADARRVAANYGLDDTANFNRRGSLTLRWIYIHMVEELARHAGHADIVRELIFAADADAATAGADAVSVSENKAGHSQ